MAEDPINEEGLAETLRKRGLSCPRLRQFEDRLNNDAKTFRSVGFENIAKGQEESAKKINALRKKVCLLK